MTTEIQAPFVVLVGAYGDFTAAAYGPFGRAAADEFAEETRVLLRCSNWTAGSEVAVIPLHADDRRVDAAARAELPEVVVR